MMDIEDALRGRRSVRHFKNDAVPTETLTQLVDDAAWAPSGGNAQPWRVTAVAPERARALLDHYEERCWNALLPKIWSLVERARQQTLGPEDALPAAARMIAEEGRTRGRPWLLLIHAEEPPVPAERIALADAWLKEHVAAPHLPSREEIERTQGPIQAGVTAAGTQLYAYHLAVLAHARGLGACLNHGLLLVADAITADLGITDSPPVVGTVLLGHPDVDSAEQHAAHARASRRRVPLTLC